MGETQSSSTNLPQQQPAAVDTDDSRRQRDNDEHDGGVASN